MVIGYALVDGFLAGNLLTGFLGAPFNVAAVCSRVGACYIVSHGFIQDSGKEIFRIQTG